MCNMNEGEGCALHAIANSLGLVNTPQAREIYDEYKGRDFLFSRIQLFEVFIPYGGRIYILAKWGKVDEFSSAEFELMVHCDQANAIRKAIEISDCVPKLLPI